MAHYFIKAVKVGEKTKYQIGKQVPNKPDTFMKRMYLRKEVARKKVDELNNKSKGAGKGRPKKMKKPEYESI